MFLRHRCPRSRPPRRARRATRYRRCAGRQGPARAARDRRRSGRIEVIGVVHGAAIAGVGIALGCARPRHRLFPAASPPPPRRPIPLRLTTSKAAGRCVDIARQGERVVIVTAPARRLRMHPVHEADALLEGRRSFAHELGPSAPSAASVRAMVGKVPSPTPTVGMSLDSMSDTWTPPGPPRCLASHAAVSHPAVPPPTISISSLDLDMKEGGRTRRSGPASPPCADQRPSKLTLTPK